MKENIYMAFIKELNVYKFEQFSISKAKGTNKYRKLKITLKLNVTLYE